MKPPLPRAGFSLLEVVIVLLVLSLVMIGFSTATISSLRTYGETSTVSDLENDANEMIARIADELRQAGSSSADWTLTSADVTYNLCTGSTAGAATWGAARTLMAEPFADDPEDNLDNNGNGLVDEKQLVVKDGAGTVVETWGAYVEKNGLSFTQSGNNITFSVTLKRLNPNHSPISVTASTVVSLRN